MTYSKLFFPQQNRVPTVVSLGIVLLIIVFLARLTGSNPVPSKASKKTVELLQIVNLIHNQAGLFWQTEEKEPGWVIFGENEQSLQKIALDERDLENKKNKFYNHYAVLKNLLPNTVYFYKLIANSQVVEESGGRAFSFKTPGVSAVSDSNLNPAYGKVIKQNGEPLEGATVVLSFDKAFSLLSISKPTGEWLVSLNAIIDKDTLTSQKVDIKSDVKIEIYSEDKEKTTINGLSENMSPIPQTVVMGKDYNFASGENVLSASIEKGTAETSKIEILYPKEGSLVPGANPLIKGTALPGNEVEIIINSLAGFRLKTTADKDGIWKLTLAEKLSPGEHTLTLISKDSAGKSVQLNRKFSVAKSGEEVLGQATPEGTPTFGLSPTMVSSPSPTLIFPSTSPTVTPPVSGLNITPLGIISSSLIILGLGILIAF